MTDTNATPDADPASLSLDDLRSLRQQLQREDDVVSYARRVAQARLDLVTSAHARRDGDVDAQIGGVLGQQLTGGPARPPRPTEDLSVHELDADGLRTLAQAIELFEARVSTDRRERFARLDALSAELVRRYRDGEANVDTLLDR